MDSQFDIERVMDLVADGMTGHGKQQTIKLMNEYRHHAVTDPQQIREIITKELIALAYRISCNAHPRSDERLIALPELNGLADEESDDDGTVIVLPEQFDFRHGHWNVLQWILGRHFVEESRQPNCRQLIPEYYLQLAAIASRQSGFRTCESVVKEMLAVLTA